MHRLILALYCAVLFFYGLGAAELYRNETLRAIIAREMLHTGNWIVPTLYGEPLFTKPPGMYLAIALCSWPLGEVTEWTARLPSALAATLTVLLAYWFFARQLDARAGLVAALIVPMSVFWLERATSAEIDMLQVVWVTASILFFLCAVADDSPHPCTRGKGVGGEGDRVSREDPKHPREILTPSPQPLSPGYRGEGLAVRDKVDRNCTKIGWLLAALLCVAGGTLTKWTAPAFFYGTAIPFLWWRGRLRVLWSWQHLLSASVAAALVLTWVGAAVALTSWDVFRDTVSREALQHLAPGQGRKAFPWQEMLLHPFKVLATTLPWSAVGLVALWPAFVRRWDERGRFVLQALHCWAWPNLLFWSLASEHSVRHSAPMFPALAGLAAMVWLGWSRGLLAWQLPRLRPAQVMAGALAVWLVVKLVFVHVALPMRAGQRQTRAKAEALALLVPLEQVLYLFRLKDEGIMFYFGRPVLRLADPHDLPTTSGRIYCVLTADEWRRWAGERAAEVVAHLQDAQGDDIVLVRVQ